MAAERLEFFEFLDIPEFDGLVGAAGGEEGPVRAEGDGLDTVGVGLGEFADELAVLGIPEANGFVEAAGGDKGAVLVEGDGVDVAGVSRSEERRVGKECRSRWSPD